MFVGAKTSLRDLLTIRVPSSSTMAHCHASPSSFCSTAATACRCIGLALASFAVPRFLFILSSSATATLEFLFLVYFVHGRMPDLRLAIVRSCNSKEAETRRAILLERQADHSVCTDHCALTLVMKEFQKPHFILFVLIHHERERERRSRQSPSATTS
jgi:hypothetical protein